MEDATIIDRNLKSKTLQEISQNTGCPNCNGNHITGHGFNHTLQGAKPRLKCQDCGASFYYTIKTTNLFCPDCNNPVTKAGKAWISGIPRQQYRCPKCRRATVKPLHSNGKQASYLHIRNIQHTQNQHTAPSYRHLKELVLTHYGDGKLACVKCGYNNIEALSIDHINGNGAEHRLKIKGSLYTWLRKNNFPTGFQTLCMNCQFIKRSENHETRKISTIDS